MRNILIGLFRNVIRACIKKDEDPAELYLEAMEIVIGKEVEPLPPPRVYPHRHVIDPYTEQCIHCGITNLEILANGGTF